MAKKYESEIDADEFIRSFREDPSSAGGLKKIQDTKESDGVPVETAQPQSSSKASRPKACSKTEEEEYVEKFIKNTSHLRPKLKYLMVEIAPEYIHMIKRIITYGEGGCSVKAYINNVLADHFKQYEDFIEKRL